LSLSKGAKGPHHHQPAVHANSTTSSPATPAHAEEQHSISRAKILTASRSTSGGGETPPSLPTSPKQLLQVRRQRQPRLRNQSHQTIQPRIHRRKHRRL